MLVVVAQHVLARVKLYLPGAVGEIQERGFAVTPAAGQPAGEPVLLIGLLSVGEAGMPRQDVGHRRAVRKAGRERLHAGCS